LKAKAGTIKDLWAERLYRINLLSMIVIWSFGTFAFFMVPYYLGSIKADFYLLNLSSEMGEFIGVAVTFPIASKMHLGKALFIFQGIVAVGALVMCFVVKNSSDSTAQVPLKDSLPSMGLIMLTNLGVVISFDLAYLIMPKLFPT